jgi:hypothetical protein
MVDKADGHQQKARRLFGHGMKDALVNPKGGGAPQRN